MINENDNTMLTAAGTMKPRMTPMPATPALDGVSAGPGNVQFAVMATDKQSERNGIENAKSEDALFRDVAAH